MTDREQDPGFLDGVRDAVRFLLVVGAIMAVTALLAHLVGVAL